MGRIYHRIGIWWKKVRILRGKYGYQFPRLSQFDGFRCIFQCYGNLMGKPKHFPCDEVYYKMGIWLKKCTHTIGKVWVLISQVVLIRWVLLDFFVLWEIDGKTHAFPIMMKYTIGWESDGKKVPKLWKKYDYQFLMFSPYYGFCCIFPCYGKLVGKPKHFPYDEIR